jgi:hypothetical protein
MIALGRPTRAAFPTAFIRSRAEELVTLEEISRIEEPLSRIGARPLGAPATPLPRAGKSREEMA